MDGNEIAFPKCITTSITKLELSFGGCKFKREKRELRFYRTGSQVPFAKVKIPNNSKSIEIDFEYNIRDLKKNYIRAELWQVNKKYKFIELLGLTNPIYINYNKDVM